MPDVRSWKGGRRYRFELLLAWLCTAIVLGAVVRLVWLSRGWGLVHDAPILHYIASRLLAGDVLYRDLWEINFPGSYLIHVAVIAVLGSGDLAWRLFDLLVLAASGGLMVLLLRRSGLVAGLLAGGTFAAYHLSCGPSMMGERDLVLVPLLLAATGAMQTLHLQLGEAPMHRRWVAGLLALAGLAAGAATMIKPFAGLFLLLVLAVSTVLARRHHLPLLRTWLLVLIPGALPTVLVVAWLLISGGLIPFLEILFGYTLPLYSTLLQPSIWHKTLRQLPWLVVLWPLPLLVVLDLLTPPRRPRAGQLLLAAGLLTGMLHYLLQGKCFLYHLSPAAAFLCLIAGDAAGALLCHQLRSVRLGCLLCLGLLAGNTLAHSRPVVLPLLQHKLTMEAQLEQLCRRELSAGDTVQVFDSAMGGAHLLLRLGLEQPSRLITEAPIFAHDPDHPTVRRLRAEVLHDLQQAPPALIIIYRAGFPTGGYERLDRFPALSAWIRQEYEIAHERNGCRVLRRKLRQDR